MKLLIVDDQSSVVNSMLNGIDWRVEGFSDVYAAYNAAEAREILLSQHINVMLSDIEMPVENGLSLVRWIREQNMPTECILLTSYMEFDYAQQAVRLQTLDYIIQPAPLEKIQLAVRKATQKIIAADVQAELENYGRIFQKQKPLIESSLLARFLTQNEIWQASDNALIHSLPPPQAEGYLVLLQMLSWEDSYAAWENSLIEIAANNITAELFSGYGQSVWLCPVDNKALAMLLSGSDYTMDMEGVERQLNKLKNICKEHLHLNIACYLAKICKVNQLYEQMPTLLRMKKDNVSFASAVFSEQGKFKALAGVTFPQFSSWEKLLTQGYIDAVKQEMLSFLDAASKNEVMDFAALYSFFIQFAQMITEQINALTGEAFHEKYGKYYLVESSLDNMKKLVTIVLEDLKKQNGESTRDDFSVAMVVEYIQNHLEDELRCDDLAIMFHVHPDYLTRLFKKQVGCALKEYICSKKMRLAQTLLQTTALPIGFIAAKIGYGNFSHFSKTYFKNIGHLPSAEERKTSMMP